MLGTFVSEPFLSLLALPLLLGLCIMLGRLLAGPLARIPVHSPLERGFIYAALGITAFSWVGTILAASGLFRPWAVLVALAAVVLAMRWLNRPSPAAEEHAGDEVQATPHPVLIVLVLLLGGAAWLYARPSENFFLTDDPAAYTVSGVLLARTGSLFFKPDAFWQTTPAFVRQFFQIARSGEFTRHWMPFYQWSLTDQTLEIGFLPLPKVWIALSAWLFGPAHATWSIPLMGLLGVGAIYAFMRRVRGWLTALIASFTLGISLPQVWFARHPTSEIIAQVFLFTGLYLLVLARKNAATPPQAHRLAAWSGLALATLAITRFEGAVLLAMLAGLFWLGWQQRDAGHADWLSTWLASLAGAGAFGTVLSLSVARHYLFTSSLLALTPRLVPPVLGAIVVLALGIFFARRAWRSQPTLARRAVMRVAGWLPVGVALGWALALIVALVRLLQGDWMNSVPGWLVQYLSPLTVALSVLGVFIVLRRERASHAPELVTLLGTAAAFLVLFSINHYVTPVHPWAVRRLLPLVIPSIAGTAAVPLALAITHARGANGSLWRKVGAWAGGLMAITLLILQGYGIGQRTYPIVRHQELKGFWSQLQAVAARFPAKALLLFDNGPIAQSLTQPMELLLDHPSLVLVQTPPVDNDSEVDKLISSALAQGRQVFFIATDGKTTWWPTRWQLDSLGSMHLDMTTLRQPTGRLPGYEDIVSRTLWLDVYQASPAAKGEEKALAESGYHISAGEGSYPFLRRGFYGWELGVEGKIARWTGAMAEIVLPWPESDPTKPASFCLRIEVAGGRPSQAPACEFVVLVEGREIYRRQLERDYAPRPLLIPTRDLANVGSSDLEIRLLSTTFTPADWGQSGDQRQLGAMLYGLGLYPPGICTPD